MGLKKIGIKKEDLFELYINKKLSSYKIAKIYNCSQATVCIWLRKFSIPRREHKFKIGCNSWKRLTKEQREKRSKKLSKRMTKYNPLFNEDVQKRVSYALKKRLGETGRLTHRERQEVLHSVGKCEYPNCGIPYPLTVHHKDGDRYNNNKENLMVVCFNHHYILEHSNAKYGYNAEFRKRR